MFEWQLAFLTCTGVAGIVKVLIVAAWIVGFFFINKSLNDIRI